ncbi:flavodoxin domain-containing protein [candidate division KSB1 bacterium]|nr:flavodoxin domain-containing protein [candidate division KSB1 bacterium]
MGKILILYDSATGNTKKMAEYVAAGAKKVSGMEIRLLHVDQAKKKDVVWCEGIAVGSPTNLGILSWKMKRFWDEEMLDLWSKIDGRIGCAFSSSGGWGGGSELTCNSILTILINYGFLVFGTPDYVGNRFTLHYGAVVAGEPRKEKEISACKKIGERLAQWVGFYIDGKKELYPLSV